MHDADDSWCLRSREYLGRVMTWFSLSKRVFDGVHAIVRTRSACSDEFATKLDDLMIQWLPPEMEPANSKLHPCCC